jgi:hypothetical protein
MNPNQENEMSDDGPNIKALRAAGHDDAADLLERVAADRARTETARRGPPGAPAHELGLSILAMDPQPAGPLAQADAQTARGMLEAINNLSADSTMTVPVFNDQNGRRR